MRRKKWWARGHGNLHLSLESYTLARDGRYHLLDAYNQKQPTFLIELQARGGQDPWCTAFKSCFLWPTYRLVTALSHCITTLHAHLYLCSSALAGLSHLPLCQRQGCAAGDPSFDWLNTFQLEVGPCRAVPWQGR